MIVAETLPCPFCGAVDVEATMGPMRNKWGMVCMACSVWRDDRLDTPEAARDAWNTRAPSAVNADLLAALEYCAREDGTHPANKVAVAKDAIAKARGKP